MIWARKNDYGPWNRESYVWNRLAEVNAAFTEDEMAADIKAAKQA